MPASILTDVNNSRLLNMKVKWLISCFAIIYKSLTFVV